MNGTAKSVLVEQLVDVMNALRLAEKAMAEASPNGRDYQNSPMTGENGVYAAQDAWHERRLMVTKLTQEIEAYAFQISQQKGGR
jgi:hypothetical protein